MTSTVKVGRSKKVIIQLLTYAMVAIMSCNIGEAQTLIPPLDVTIRFDDNYDLDDQLREWAELAAATVKEQYPFLIAMLDSEGYKPPGSVKIIFSNLLSGGAGARIRNGVGEILISYNLKEEILEGDQIRNLGNMIHELVHVLQGYPSRDSVDWWVREGIAEYFNFFWYQRISDISWVNPETAKYNDGYWITAAFFDWIVRTKDASFIKRLNAACRKGNYSIEQFKVLTGMSVDELWDEFIQSFN